MAALLKKVLYVSKRIKMNEIYPWKKHSFHTSYGLFDQAKFNEKPKWLKKLKMEQAAMQKDDGVPVFLKKGLPDKILYNITLISTIIGVLHSFKVLADLEPSNKNND